MESKLFSPVTFGPLTLRNRTIRSAAFESMCPENTSHADVAGLPSVGSCGGSGYDNSGLCCRDTKRTSFDRQLWLRPSIIPVYTN